MRNVISYKLICFLIISFLPIFVLAQNATFKGKITDSKTNEALIGVNVKLGSSGASTDLDGNFLVSMPAGEYNLEISYLGFDNITELINLESGQTLVKDFQLSEESTLLNQVVVTGSKFEKKLSEETVSIEVISPEMIEANNNTQIDDAIEQVPGVTVVDGQANIRGGSGYSYGAGSRVLLLTDDIPALQADAGFPNWSFVPIENVEQVEVIKGAASALYGSSAMNGIINIRTAYPKSKPEGQVSAFYTVYQNPRNNETDRVESIEYQINTIDVGGTTINDTISTDTTFKRKNWWNGQQPFESGMSFAYRKKFGQFDLVTGAYLFGSDGWRQGEYSRRGRFNVYTRYRFKNIPGLSLTLNMNTQVSRSSSFFIWNGLEQGLYQSWDDLGELTTTKAFLINVDPSITYFDKWSNKHKLQTRFFKTDNDNGNNQGNFGKYYYGEYQFQRKFDEVDFAITSGLVGTYNSVNAELYAGNYNGSNIAAYAQLDKKFFDKLNVSAGIRYERNRIEKETDGRPVGRFGLNYEAAEFTFIRGSFGQGYRFPTIAEKFISTSLGSSLFIIPSDSLSAETGWSSELGIKQGYKIGKNWKGFVDVAAFWTQYNDMMEFNLKAHVFPGQTFPVIAFQSNNVGNTDIKGVELTLVGQGNFGKDVELTVLSGYTFIDPKYRDFDQDSTIALTSTSDENELKYRFNHTFKSSMNLRYKKFHVGNNVQFYSPMTAIDAAFYNLLPGVGDYIDETEDKSTWVIDVRLGYDITEKGRIDFIVKNVANKEYAIRPALIEAPRNFTAKYTHSF